MNDLAEKALDGCAVAVRAARTRALVTAGVAGFVLAAIAMVAGSRVGAAVASRPLTTWLGLQNTYDVRVGDPLPGVVLLAAILALLAVWALTVRVVRVRRLPARDVWWVFAAWAAPFAAGPPLLDTSLYRYAAFALLQRQDRDPYSVAPSGLGFDRVAEAVDPGSRGVPSGAGPLGTLVQHVAASVGTGNALAIVLLLRAVALVSGVWIGRVAVRFAAPRTQRGAALAMTVLNPLVLLFVVSAGRLEGVVAALALSAVAAAGRRAWTRSLVLAALAGAVLPVGFAVVLAVGAAHLHQRRDAVWRTLARDVPVVAVAVAVPGLVVPNGFGWVGTIRDQFATHTPFSVAEATGKVLSPIVRDATYDTLGASARLATVLAAAVTVLVLLLGAGTRPVDRTGAYCLLAIGLLAPNFYPWFVVAGVACLAPRADARRAVWTGGVSAAACVVMPGGFGDTLTQVLAGAALLLVALVMFVVLRMPHTLRLRGLRDPSRLRGPGIFSGRDWPCRARRAARRPDTP